MSRGLVPVLEVAQKGLQLSGIGAMIHSLLGIAPHLCMEFINYVRSFYGPGGIYDMKATDAMIIDATVQYLTTPGIHWADGDSYDREQVRDIMIERFGLVAVWELAQGGLQCPPIPDTLHSFLKHITNVQLDSWQSTHLRVGWLYSKQVTWCRDSVTFDCNCTDQDDIGKCVCDACASLWYAAFV